MNALKSTFDHLAIRVKDIDGSVEFLKALLGESATVIDLSPSAKSDEMRLVLVRTEGGVLFELHSEGGEGPANGPDYGMIHYCFGVEDVDAAYRAAIAAGAEERIAPGDITSPNDPEQAIRLAFVVDRNGDVCEFIDHDWIDRVDVLRQALRHEWEGVQSGD